jgi:hypothetical protein
MKKLFAIVTALVLFASTSGLVFAQSSTAPGATPTEKKVTKHKTHKKVKKTVAPVTTPVSK